ncbi:MAG TPA: HAD family phosphatase [bacterium]|nr:HAD family phosphatase [bacterium]
MTRTIPKPKAVIFDMDGVIVDSMPYHYIAWYEALLPYGIRVSCIDVFEREGEIWGRTLGDFFGRIGVAVTPELSREVYEKRQRIFKKIYKRNIFGGAVELIEQLKRKGFMLGLVTGTPTNEIRKILPSKVRAMFDCIVAGNHVKHGKPHPEPYLKAAAALGLKPRECLVIENGPHGITSAKAAGMFCVGVETSLPKNYIGHADIVVQTLQDVDRLLVGKCKKEKR